MKMTKISRCCAKIVYYIVLIAYHGCDNWFDWCNYFELYAGKPFSGIDEFLFCFSCAFGLLISLAMIVVYARYIKYHWDCIRHRCRGYKLYLLCDKKCNRHFNEVELLLSVMELLGKDNIQSGVLIWMCNSQPIFTPLSWHLIAFSLCSVCAYVKLAVCFVTKLFGCGVGEEECLYTSASEDNKALACVFGSMNSVLWFFFSLGTSIYLLQFV